MPIHNQTDRAKSSSRAMAAGFGSLEAEIEDVIAMTWRIDHSAGSLLFALHSNGFTVSAQQSAARRGRDETFHDQQQFANIDRLGHVHLESRAQRV